VIFWSSFCQTLIAYLTKKLIIARLKTVLSDRKHFLIYIYVSKVLLLASI